MKKILLLEPSAIVGSNGGGSFVQAKYYEKILKKRGLEVELYHGSLREHAFLRKLKVILKITRADFIIGFGTPLFGFYLQWIIFLLNKKGIIAIDTIIIDPKEIVNDYYQRGLFSLKIIFFTFLSSVRYKLSQFLLPPKLNLITFASSKFVYEKIKNTRFTPVKNKVLYPKISLNRTQTKANKIKSVLFYGSLFNGRGIIELLQACKLLWKRGLKFKLLIFGHPVEYYTQRALLKEISKEDKKNIILFGRRENIQRIVRRATVVVLPCRYHCSYQPPLTVIEPMAWGVPVVTTDMGANSEWIKDNETGLICKKDDINDIAEKIEMILNNKLLRRKLVNNAYALVARRNGEKDILLSQILG